MKKLFASCMTAGLLVVAAQAGDPFFQASLTPDIAVQPKTKPITGLTLSIWGENPQHGVALGFVNGTTATSGGLDLGFFVNYGENFVGAQLAPVNFMADRMTGLQFGVVNYAGTLSGVQLGLLNVAKTTDAGVQLGLINLIQENQAWFSKFPNELAPGMIFVNWRF